MHSPGYKPSEAEKQFIKYHNKLQRETLNAIVHLKLWEQLENCTSNYLDELNYAPDFFLFTIKSHVDDAVLTLSRILDIHESSLSIWKFLNFVEQNCKIFSAQAFQQRMSHRPEWLKSHRPVELEEIQAHRQKLENPKDVVSSIKTWRDKVLAHIDRRFFLKHKNVNVKREKLQEVIEILTEILNRYSVAFDSSFYAFNFAGINDVQIIIDAIHTALEERKRERNVLITKSQT